MKINTGIAESLASKGYQVTMIIGGYDETVDKLKQKGVNVMYEPKLPESYAKKNKEITDYTRKNQNLWNVWDVSATNVNRLLVQQFGFYEKIKAMKFDMIITE